MRKICCGNTLVNVVLLDVEGITTSLIKSL